MKRWLLRLAVVYAVLLTASHLVRWWSAAHPKPSDDLQRVTIPAFVQRTPVKGLTVEVAYRHQPAKKPGAPVVILIHGSPVASVAMTRLFPYLEDYEVYAPDLPGMGDSTRVVPDYSIRAHGSALLAFMNAQGIEQALVVAYSMGGGAALEASQLAPHRIQGLVLLSSIGVQEYELFGSYEVNHAVHGAQLALFWLLQEGVPHFGLLDRFPLNLSYARNFYDSDQRPLRTILEHYKGPMLILQGENDEFVPPAAAREHHRLVPQSELITCPGGHLLLFENPEWVAAQCRTFFERVERGEALTRDQTSRDLRLRAIDTFVNDRSFQYVGVALWVALIGIAVATLVSEDLACIGAGLLVAHGVLPFTPVLLACFAGIVFGDVGLYVLGRLFGRKALRKRPLRWLLNEAQVEQAARWFHEQGSTIIFVTRFLPGTRAPVYFTAGSVHAPIWSFLLYFMIAAAIWTPLIVGASYLLGNALLPYYRALSSLALPLALFLGLFFYLVVHYGLPLFTWRGRRLLLSKWRRGTRWEFWPLWQFNIPIFFHVLRLGWTYKNPLLFTVVNPGIPHSGFVGESKSQILQGLAGAGENVATWRLIPAGHDTEARWQAVEAFRQELGGMWPLVLKPDEGQRGLGVAIIRSEEQGRTYLSRQPGKLIAQRYIPGKEFGVFYVRHPDEPVGRIISLTIKEMTSVTGDGQHDLEHLILADNRTVCLAPFYLKKNRERLAWIPAAGEVVTLIDVGAHARGSTFYDGMHLIAPELTAKIDEIAKSFEGFHFGRFDIRVPSAEDLSAGRNLRVIELNGVTSESTHMYDPNNPLANAYQTMFAQWRLAFAIADANRTRGHRPWTWADFVAHWRETHQRQGAIKRAE